MTTIRPRGGLRRWAENAPVGAIAAAVFVAAVLYLTLCMNRNVNEYDEGFILLDATRVLDGDVPHRDFYTIYGPGQIYVLAALYKIFGISVLVERAWDTVVRGCVVMLVFIVVDQAAPRRCALMASGASLVCLASFGTYGYPVYPALAGALSGLAFLAPALARPIPASGLVAAGICAGVVTLFRYDVGVVVFGAECAVVAFRAWSGREDLAGAARSTVRLLGLFAAGFAIVVVPVGAAFAYAGAIGDLVFQVVSFPARSYVRTRGLPFPRPWGHFGELADFTVYLPLVLCAAAVPVMAAIARRQRSNAGRRETGILPPTAILPPGDVLSWTLLTLVVMILVFFAKGSVRVTVVGMGMSVITSLALAGVLAQPLPGRGWFGRGMIAVSLVAVLAFTVHCLHIGFNLAQRNYAWASNPASWEASATGAIPELGSCRMPPGLERLTCFRVSPAELETIRFVQQRTDPGERVFVGLGRHDKIIANDVLLYFAMNRRSATKWHQFDPGLETLEPIQREMVGELRRVNPRIIVLETQWDDMREGNESAISSGVTALDDYIRSAFKPVATFGTNIVLMGRSAEPPE